MELEKLEEVIKIYNNVKPLLILHPNLSSEAIYEAISAIQKLQQHVSLCLSIAKSGFPKEKEHVAVLKNEIDFKTGNLVEARTIKDWVKYGYNQARQECLAFLSAKLEGMKEVMRNTKWAGDFEDMLNFYEKMQKKNNIKIINIITEEVKGVITE